MERMKNTSTYNREYYLKNKERISENQKMRIKNMTAEEREIYLNRMKNWYRNRRGRFVSKSELQEENKKLKEERDFFYKSAKQFREDAESWRKEAELLLGIKIFGKTLAERIEDDKKVVRMDTSCMEEDTLQELRDLGEI